jgi:hypothetical protein
VASAYHSRAIPECIFTTQPADDPSKLIIGATVADYPARHSVIKRSTRARYAGLAQASERPSAEEGIKGLFKNERFERLDMVYQTKKELTERFRPLDQKYMEPLSLFDTVIASGRTDTGRNDFLSRATVNFYIGQRRRTTADWKQFNHRNQIATSFFVVRHHLMQINQRNANAEIIEYCQ